MSLIEIVAAIFGFLSVWFYIFRNPASWPTGLVQVLLLWSVFWNAKLYADFGLHVLYAILQIYGWWAWLKVRRTDDSAKGDITERSSFADSSPYDASSKSTDSSTQDEVRVRSLSQAGLVGCILAVPILTSIFAGLLIRYTDATLPIWDSLIAAASIIAQCLLAARYVENWRFWIAVDIVGIGLFAYKELYPTAVLYILFLVMAIWGDIAWRKSLRQMTATNLTAA
ncbi:MAG: nicotinamide riboside transporter PnuC [Pirellula sp.]|nr:nicotinamide riboside transporter PnuC [Pirellula sp.]